MIKKKKKTILHTKSEAKTYDIIKDRSGDIFFVKKIDAIYRIAFRNGTHSFGIIINGKSYEDFEKTKNKKNIDDYIEELTKRVVSLNR